MEEMKAKSDLEKPASKTPPISLTNTVADIAATTEEMTIHQDDPLLMNSPTFSLTEVEDEEAPE